MSETLNKKLGLVIEQHKNSPKTQGAKPFGFYWTRKSGELAQHLIENFCPKDGVVLDPFFGSGSTALGLAKSSGRRLFVGVELNEMPLENLKLSLGQVNESFASELELAQVELRRIQDLYRFEIDSGSVQVGKIIHEFKGSELAPTEIIGNVNGKLKRFSREHNREDFLQLIDQYSAKVQGLPSYANESLAANSRIAIKPGMQVSDVFGPLAFAALSMLKLGMGQSLVYKLVIGAALHLCRLTDAKSQSQFPFWFPKQEIHEKSVFDVVSKKLKEFQRFYTGRSEVKGLELVDTFQDWTPGSTKSALLLRGSAVSIMKESIPDGTVDLVITDPPYFDQVAYSEYLKLWEFFTGFEADLENEIVESGRVGAEKSRDVFLRDLEGAFRETRRTMKEGAVALIYFKDSKPRNLHDFIYCLERVGLRYETQVHLFKPSYTYKQNSSKENTVGGDSLMVFTAGIEKMLPQAESAVPIEDLDNRFQVLFGNYISKNGPCTLTEALDNSLIGELYPTGYLGRIKASDHFAKVLSKQFSYDPASRKWSVAE